MQMWIALLRGINVGGNNMLPMTTLKRDLESLKLKQVRTYIQSGNVVFESPDKTASSLTKKIAARIEEQHGFLPQVLILSREDLLKAIQSNPFPKAVPDPKTLHFFFLAQPAVAPNVKALNDAKSAKENYKIVDRVFYLYAPDGIGRSKLAANAEKYLGVMATARNYRTVVRLSEMVERS
jgi:uncharacterized protein (DUF1697 family)